MASAVLFTNGRIFDSTPEASKTTDDDAANFHNCILVRNGVIEHVGKETDALVMEAKKDAEVRDLSGRTVLPGFVDGHAHFLMLGRSLQMADLTPCKSLDDIRAVITKYAAENPDAPRILCRSWMHSMTPDGVSAALLDDLDAPRHRPIYIDTKDLHAVWCSTAALKEMGLLEGGKNQDKVIAGGTIFRDDKGRPTGVMDEAFVFEFWWPMLAELTTLDERLANLTAAIDTYRAAGYTGVVDMAMNEEDWEAICCYLDQHDGHMPLRIAAHWMIKPRDNEADRLVQVERAAELRKKFDGGPDSPYGNKLRLVGIKLVCDGIVDACTAYLSEPYGDAARSDPGPIWTAEQLQPVVNRATAAGLQVALHAIGDATVAMALDVLEAVPADLNLRALRPRIEHLELTSPESAARLGRLGVTASVQAVHADPAIVRAWPKLLGSHRCGRAFAYREFADGGATVALGTDAPTAPTAPLGNTYVATTRRSAREPDCADTFNPHFALGLCEALAGYTSGSAYSCGADAWTGTLAVGKSADFVVVDMKWDAKELLSARVQETWFEGRQVWAE